MALSRRFYPLLILAVVGCRSTGPATPREPSSFLALIKGLAPSTGALTCDTTHSPDRAGRRVRTLSCGSQLAGGAFHYIARHGRVDQVYRSWAILEPGAEEQAWETAASLLRSLGAKVLECGGTLGPGSPMARISTWSLGGHQVVLAVFRSSAVGGQRQVVLQANDVPPGPLCRQTTRAAA